MWRRRDWGMSLDLHSRMSISRVGLEGNHRRTGPFWGHFPNRRIQGLGRHRAGPAETRAGLTAPQRKAGVNPVPWSPQDFKDACLQQTGRGQARLCVSGLQEEPATSGAEARVWQATGRPPFGRGSKLSHQWTAGLVFGSIYLGSVLGTNFLTHSHLLLRGSSFNATQL